MAEEKKTETTEAAEVVENHAVTVIDDSNIVHLTSPLSNGQQELIFDWGKITGYTLIKCLSSAKKQDPGMAVPALSLPYQAAVAAVAAGVRYDDILGLSGPDFMATVIHAQNFLLQSGT